jgi:mercuric ion transport protein
LDEKDLESTMEKFKATPETGRLALLAGGIAAILASTCCLGPLVLVLLGVSGAWIGNLTALESYRPVFIGVALVALFFAYRRIFRPAQACAPGEVCAIAQVQTTYKVPRPGISLDSALGTSYVENVLRRIRMSNANKHDAGASEGARRATGEAPASSAGPGGGRWSAKRKVSVILELLRGADLETTSRKHRVTVATLSEWRDRFLAAGEGGLKSREVEVDEEEKRRLKSVVASVSVENELLREKIARLESGRPFAGGSREHEPHRLAFHP